MNDIFSLDTYDYNLPQCLIAQTPLADRSSSRLLIYNGSDDTISHQRFDSIVDFLRQGDVLVMNNTRVMPARLYGIKEDTGAKVEILLLKRHSLNEWSALARPLKRLKAGTILDFSHTLRGIVKSKSDTECIIEFSYDGVFEAILDVVGQMPLPHYIHAELSDNERYQTVYSQVVGSTAAPTAGLHFTTEILDQLISKGVIITYVTLDIGLGTFRPCASQNILEHKMHTEHFTLSRHTADTINAAKAEHRRVICVGTTSVRVVESASRQALPLIECAGDTDIFIYPGYTFNIVEAMITNFHLPKSTLIMLVSAFIGVEQTKRMYEQAVHNEYRFFSFGDSCLLI